MSEHTDMESYLYAKAALGVNGYVRSCFGMCPSEDPDTGWDPTEDPNIRVEIADCAFAISGYTEGQKPFFLNLNGWYAVKTRVDFGEDFRWSILYLKSVIDEADEVERLIVERHPNTEAPGFYRISRATRYTKDMPSPESFYAIFQADGSRIPEPDIDYDKVPYSPRYWTALSRTAKFQVETDHPNVAFEITPKGLDAITVSARITEDSVGSSLSIRNVATGVVRTMHLICPKQCLPRSVYWEPPWESPEKTARAYCVRSGCDINSMPTRLDNIRNVICSEEDQRVVAGYEKYQENLEAAKHAKKQ